MFPFDGRAVNLDKTDRKRKTGPSYLFIVMRYDEAHFYPRNYCKMWFCYITLKQHSPPRPLIYKGKRSRAQTRNTRTHSAGHPSVAAGTFWLIPDPLCPTLMKEQPARGTVVSGCHDKNSKIQDDREKLFCFFVFWFASVCVLSRHANILSPYSKAVPAIIAKASTIYNPFIYAIIHNKYRWIMKVSVDSRVGLTVLY